MGRLQGFRLVLIFCFFLFSHFCFCQDSDSSKIEALNRQGALLIKAAKFDEAVPFCDSALRIKENGRSHYLLSFIYNTKNEWNKSIEHGEKAIAFDPGFNDAYLVLFKSYYGAKQWHKALSVSDKALATDEAAYVREFLPVLNAYDRSASISKIIVPLVIIGLLGILFIPLYKRNLKSYPISTTALIIGATVTGILYFLFFQYSEQIWSQNPKIPPREFTPFVRGAVFERDGIEGFVLYALTLASIVISLLISFRIIKMKINKTQYVIAALILLLFISYYFFKIGFFPPVPDGAQFDGGSISLVFFVTALTMLLYWLGRWSPVVTISILVLLIAFSTLIAVFPPSLNDLSFVLAPAQRLESGAKIPDVYFQYDLMLSGLAYLWLKLNFSIEWFPFLGQLGFFFFFLLAMFFAHRFFKIKGLFAAFIIALILVRYYAVWEEGVTIFQLSPLRLDLWLILLFIAYKKGIHHWVVAVAMSFLIIFHRNLGLIYCESYLLAFAIFFMLDLVFPAESGKLKLRQVVFLLGKHLRMNAINLGIIAGSFLISYFISGEIIAKSAITYRKYGINLLPISPISVFWYLPIILTLLVATLIYYRKKIDRRYFTTSIFLLCLAMGNLIYFFGRSHENNFLNISASVILCLFTLIDLLLYTSTPQKEPDVKTQKKLKVKAPQKRSMNWQLLQFSPVLLVLLISFFYSNRIKQKLGGQYDNLLSQQFKYPLLQEPVDTATIRQLTHDSKKVYFLDFMRDFYSYYYGGYTLQGYYNPCNAWPFRKDHIAFIQTLLDDGYYVIQNTEWLDFSKEYFPYLNYNSSQQKNTFLAIHKDSVPYLLSPEPGDLFHVAIKDSLASPGIQHAEFPLQQDFTIEVIIKPAAGQLQYASVIDNYLNTDRLRGFSFQMLDPNNAVIGYSDGSSRLPAVVFPLQANKWHCLAITVNKDSMNVFDNGKRIANAASNGRPILINPVSFTIGNRDNGNNYFHGLIREVRIKNGRRDETKLTTDELKADSVLNIISLH